MNTKLTKGERGGEGNITNIIMRCMPVQVGVVVWKVMTEFVKSFFVNDTNIETKLGGRGGRP